MPCTYPAQPKARGGSQKHAYGRATCTSVGGIHSFPHTKVKVVHDVGLEDVLQLDQFGAQLVFVEVVLTIRAKGVFV